MAEPRPLERAQLDRFDIHDALMRYCRGVDRCIEALVRSAYHEDSFDDHGYWKGNGWDFATFIVTSLAERSLRTTHAVANELIELDGDSAHVESYVFAYLWRGDASSETAQSLDLFAGRYVDRFERREDQWRITQRAVVHDWTKSERVEASGLGLPIEQFSQGRRGASDPVFDR